MGIVLFCGFVVVPDVSLTLGLLPDIVNFSDIQLQFCSFIESQVLACPGRECLTFDPFTALMPHVGMIPRSAEAMPRLSGVPCVQFSKKVLSSPI